MCDVCYSYDMCLKWINLAFYLVTLVFCLFAHKNIKLQKKKGKKFFCIEKLMYFFLREGKFLQLLTRVI